MSANRRIWSREIASSCLLPPESKREPILRKVGDGGNAVVRGCEAWLVHVEIEQGPVLEVHAYAWSKANRQRSPAPRGIDALYTLRITQSRRAIAYRDGNFLRFLTIAADHARLHQAD